MPFQDLYFGGSSPQYPVVQPSNLSFGGVPEIGNVNSASLSYGGNFPSPQFSTFDNSPDLFTSLLSSFSVGSSTTARSPTDFQYASTPQPNATVNTAAVDGSTGYISNLAGQLGGLLNSIGSTGDSSGTVPIQAAYQPTQQGALSPTVIMAVLAVGAAIYYATSK